VARSATVVVPTHQRASVSAKAIAAASQLAGPVIGTLRTANSSEMKRPIAATQTAR
jgi:hypothetical protein